MLGTLEPSKPVLGTRVFVDLLDPSLATWNLETLPGTLTENLRNSWGLYLESLLGALEPSETLLKNLCWEPRPSLGTFQNLYSYLDGTYMLYLEPRNLPEPLLGTLARNLGTSEPSGTLYNWNPYLEPRNLPEPLLGTLILGTSEPSEPYLEPLLGTSEPAGTFTWNPYTWNLGTCRNLYLEPLLGTSEPAGTFTWNPYLEPRNLPEPLLGTLTWNLGTCRNLYLEPLLGTSEPARTWRDDCPRVPQGLVWLGPQSFQLLGKKKKITPSLASDTWNVWCIAFSIARATQLEAFYSLRHSHHRSGLRQALWRGQTNSSPQNQVWLKKNDLKKLFVCMSQVATIIIRLKFRTKYNLP